MDATLAGRDLGLLKRNGLQGVMRFARDIVNAISPPALVRRARVI